MSKRTNPALIGGFVLAALVILALLLIYLGSGKYSGNWYRFSIYFQGSAAGLQLGAPVVLKGVTIGQVTSIQVGFYPEDEDFIVPVVFEIDGDKILWTEKISESRGSELLQQLIAQGLRGRLDLQSVVTGQLRVELGFFPGTEVALRGQHAKYPEIPSIPSTLENLKRALDDFPVEKLAATILRVVEGLDRLINAPETMTILDNVSLASRNLPEITGAVAQRIGPMGDEALLAIGEVRELVRHATGVLQHQGDNLDRMTADALTLVRNLDSRAQGAIEAIRSAAGAAEKAFAGADRTFRSADQLLGADSPLRYQLLTLLKNLSDAARSLRAMADYLERHPDALIRGKN